MKICCKTSHGITPPVSGSQMHVYSLHPVSRKPFGCLRKLIPDFSMFVSNRILLKNRYKDRSFYLCIDYRQIPDRKQHFCEKTSQSGHPAFKAIAILSIFLQRNLSPLNLAEKPSQSCQSSFKEISVLSTWLKSHRNPLTLSSKQLQSGQPPALFSHE
jgi:hypothetical protein